MPRFDVSAITARFQRGGSTDDESSQAAPGPTPIYPLAPTGNEPPGAAASFVPPSASHMEQNIANRDARAEVWSTCKSLDAHGATCGAWGQHVGGRCINCWQSLVEHGSRNDIVSLAAESVPKPVWVWLAIAMYSDPAIVTSLTTATDCPPEILRYCSTFDELATRRNVAKNPATPPRALTVLSRDEDPTVLSYVSQNPAFSGDRAALEQRLADAKAAAAAAAESRAASGPGTQPNGAA